MRQLFYMVAVTMAMSLGLFGAGTDAGTQIQNSVTLTYQVGGVDQTPINADDGNGFVVDLKVDFTVTNDDGDQVNTVPGATGVITTWTLTNTSNDDMNFTLSATNLTGGESIYGDADTIDASALSIEYSTDGGTTWNTYASGNVINILEDNNILVRVKADIPPSAVNNDIINVQLEATATDGSGTALTATAGADNEDSVDTVLAEGVPSPVQGNTQYDGKYSAWGGYKIVTATLNVTKTSCVVWDPVNGATNPKRIPLGMVRYAIEVQNTGSADATGVQVSDPLDNALTYGQSTASGAPAAVAEIRDAACDCASPAGNVIGGDTVTESAGTVTMNFNTVTQGSTKCAYFDVYIN